jgi:very-short-patch-repair endonuclease
MKETCRRNFAKATDGNRGKHRSPETREKIGASQRGVPRPYVAEFNRRPETLAKRAVSMKDRIARGDAPWVRGNLKQGTKLEAVMAALLEWAGVEFETQKQIGTKFVDFYIPQADAVIEADGVWWHQDGPDAERDALLLQDVSAVTHITDEQLRAAGWL